MARKTKHATFADVVDASRGGEAVRLRPSHIRLSAENQRWAPYETMNELKPFIGDKCWFTSAQIEQRLKSFLGIGQETAIKVSISNTGHPDIEVGFLRWCAFLLAEVRGIMDDIPGAKGQKVTGIRAEVVKAPKSQADHATRARRNFAENIERQQLSPIDIALYIKRRLKAIDDDGKSLTVAELAEEMDRSVDYINKHKRVFDCLTPEELLAVHENRLPLSRALKRASNRGSGNNTGSRGTNRGTKHTAMRRALEFRDTRKPPAATLNAAQIVQLTRLLAGDEIHEDELDVDVNAWHEWIDAPKDLKPRKAPAKRNNKEQA